MSATVTTRRSFLSLTFMSIRLTWILLVLAGLITAEELEPPDIIPDSHIVNKKVGDTLVLTCHGDAPMFWNYTHIIEEHEKRLSIQSGENATGSKPHWTVLTLQDLSYLDVGYFSCIYNSSIDKDELNENLVYVMVEDREHLLVCDQNECPTFVQHLHVNLGRRVVIPCKPTSESVTIEISNDNPIKLTNENYSKTEGYTILTAMLHSTGQYECKATWGNVQEVRTYILSVTESHSDLSTPEIIEDTGGSVSVGATFTLICRTRQEQLYYNFNWTGPSSVIRSSRASIANSWVLPNQKLYQTRITITNATKEDAGDYVCTVRNSRTHKSVSAKIGVYYEEERFLNVSTRNETISVEEIKDYNAKWVINISSYPPHPQFKWLRNGTSIIPNHTYEIINKTSQEFILKINSVRLEHAGSYQFIADVPQYPELKEVLNLTLIVTKRPEIQRAVIGEYFLANQEYELKCHAVGFPIPKIRWFFRSCSKFQIIGNKYPGCKDYVAVPEDQMSELITSHQKSERSVKFNATHHGMLKCNASNSLGNSEQYIKRIYVADFPGQKGFGITKPEQIVEGDDLVIQCGASKLKYNNSLQLQRKIDTSWSTLSPNPSGLFIHKVDSDWSWQAILEFKKISVNDKGDYRLIINDNENTSEIFSLKVENMEKPIIVKTNLTDKTLNLKEGDTPPLNLFCISTGRPPPTIYWFRNDELPSEWPSDIKYQISNDTTTLQFEYNRHEVSGDYRCDAVNRVGKASAKMILEVKGPSNRLHPALIFFLVLVVILMFGLLFCLAKKIHKERRLKREMRNLYKVEFEDGAVENINPTLGIEDQVSLLPYDRKWEFPKERIKLGMQLGSGAFGRVVKAEATGIKKDEAVTEVAVKMVKANADESHIKALMSELKIMVHLGQHVNVVNLLGAITKNLSKKRELLVIVEYCKYGSLLSYLHRHKHSFINQLDPEHDVIDPNICKQDDLSCRQSQVPKLNYAALTFTDTGNNRPIAPNGYRTLEELGSYPVSPSTPPPDIHPNRCDSSFSEGYATGGNMNSVGTDMSYCPSVIDTDGQRRSSSSSTCIGHYRGDYKHREVTEMTTSDLLSWSFQIARGMDYLASRKVLHGDLAARNVLLAEGGVVKICDFGLAKEMYKDYKYKKKSEGVLLPVKWMAIESIYFAEFSTQSDAWSFGVVLWEVFTLGKTPYPGMEADDRFYKMLNDGYRMEKPPLAPSSIYDLMMNCWSHEPSSRPTFAALSDRIGDLMEENNRQHYIDLNVSFDKSNKLRLQTNPDYLARMASPEFRINDQDPAEERMYANVPESLTTSQQNTSHNKYQNVNFGSENFKEATVQPLAENAGYMFVNHSSPTQEDFHRSFPQVVMANNDGYSLTTPFVHSPGPIDVFSPRPVNPNLREDLEFNFDDTMNSCNENNQPPIYKNTSQNHPPSTFSSFKHPTEVSGISNIHYVPNSAIISPSLNLKEFNDNNAVSPKRQKNDSGVSSIGSNHFENKSPSPPICSNGDNDDELQNNNGFLEISDYKHQVNV